MFYKQPYYFMIFPRNFKIEIFQALPEAEEIEILIKNDNVEAVLAHKYGCKTGLLFAVWLDNKNILKVILDNNGDPKITDNYGR